MLGLVGEVIAAGDDHLLIDDRDLVVGDGVIVIDEGMDALIQEDLQVGVALQLVALIKQDLHVETALLGID